MLLKFVSSWRECYTIKILILLMQHDLLLSLCLAEELIWGRFIKTHDQVGKNTPNNLRCEHLDCLYKGCITNLQINKTEG